MSKKEVGRREGIQRIIDGVIRQVAGAKQLGLSDRQVRRLCRSYEAEGARALVRKKRGRASNRRLWTMGSKRRYWKRCGRATKGLAPHWRPST